YWLVHVDVTDEPYTSQYKVEQLVDKKVIRVDFRLGFRVEQQISLLLRKVIEEMVANKEIDITSSYDSLRNYGIVGDFRFVVLQKTISRSNNLGCIQKIVIAFYHILHKMALSQERGFGLDPSFVTVERVPLIIAET